MLNITRYVVSIISIIVRTVDRTKARSTVLMRIRLLRTLCMVQRTETITTGNAVSLLSSMIVLQTCVRTGNCPVPRPKLVLLSLMVIRLVMIVDLVLWPLCGPLGAAVALLLPNLITALLLYSALPYHYLTVAPLNPTDSWHTLAHTVGY